MRPNFFITLRGKWLVVAAVSFTLAAELDRQALQYQSSGCWLLAAGCWLLAALGLVAAVRMFTVRD